METVTWFSVASGLVMRLPFSNLYSTHLLFTYLVYIFTIISQSKNFYISVSISIQFPSCCLILMFNHSKDDCFYDTQCPQNFFMKIVLYIFLSASTIYLHDFWELSIGRIEALCKHIFLLRPMFVDFWNLTCSLERNFVGYCFVTIVEWFITLFYIRSEE